MPKTDIDRVYANGAWYTINKENIDDLNNALTQKAPISLISKDGNLLFDHIPVDGYYYTNRAIENPSYSYFVINFEEGVEYTEVGVRFAYTEDGTEIINDGNTRTVRKFTLNTTQNLYISINHTMYNVAYIGKTSDYSTGASRYTTPNFNANLLAQIDGQSTTKPASQKLVHDIISDNISDIKPESIRGINYADDSIIFLPQWTNGKYAYANVGDIINILDNNNLSYIVIPVTEGSVYFSNSIRFACVCDSNGIVLSANTVVDYVDIPENGTTLYISANTTGTDSFKCSTHTTSLGATTPNFNSAYNISFPAYEKAIDLILNRANKFSIFRLRENACKVGRTWYTNGSYALYDTYWFKAEANVQYTFGCSIRFMTVDETLFRENVPVGFTYTPEEDCIVCCSISKNIEKNSIKCVTAPTTINEVNPPDVPTFNPNVISQEEGNSTTLLMSQAAITEAIKTTKYKLYGKGYATVTGNLANGETFTVPKTNVKKNNTYNFVCKITSFSSILIGHGKTVYDGNYFEITGTKVILHTYYTTDTTIEWTHGLNISDYLYVQIQVGNGTAKIQMYSNGQSFSQDNLAWSGDGDAKSFVESIGSTLTDCVFTWSSGDFRKSVWAFGDSYFGYKTSARWCYYLDQNEYLDNVLLNAYPGENTTASIQSLNAMITNYGCPNFIVWCLGMNDGSDPDVNTPSSSWLNGVNTVLNICEEKAITPIFATIPSVPGRTGVSPICHEGKNNWVRNSGYRYIDFAKAVGATWDGANTTWYNGMISSDGVHPDVAGAIALYYRAITDVPEFTFTNP